MKLCLRIRCWSLGQGDVVALLAAKRHETGDLLVADADAQILVDPATTLAAIERGPQAILALAECRQPPEVVGPAAARAVEADACRGDREVLKQKLCLWSSFIG